MRKLGGKPFPKVTDIVRPGLSRPQGGYCWQCSWLHPHGWIRYYHAQRAPLAQNSDAWTHGADGDDPERVMGENIHWVMVEIEPNALNITIGSINGYSASIIAFVDMMYLDGAADISNISTDVFCRAPHPELLASP